MSTDGIAWDHHTFGSLSFWNCYSYIPSNFGRFCCLYTQVVTYTNNEGYEKEISKNLLAMESWRTK